MRETIEFRVPERSAQQFLPAGMGRSLGIARVIVLEAADAGIELIGRLDRQRRAEGSCLFTSWQVTRRFTRSELQRASLFHAWPKRTFEPAGEECGTTYDDARACPECGADAPQAGPLFLDGRRIPKSVDIACTIADEIVVSRRFVEAFRAHQLTGVGFEPVRLSNEAGVPSEHHFQPRFVGARVELAPATRAGEDIFDGDAYGRCSRGDLLGLNLLSQVTVESASLPDLDVVCSRQLVGVRRGLLRPRRVLLLSARAWRVIDAEKLKGLTVEVAHVA